MIYCRFPGNREEPPEYEYSDEICCEKCLAIYDEVHVPRDIKPVGFDKNHRELFICWECAPGFTCDACDHLGIQPTDENGLGDCCRLKVRAA